VHLLTMAMDLLGLDGGPSALLRWMVTFAGRLLRMVRWGW